MINNKKVFKIASFYMDKQLKCIVIVTKFLPAELIGTLQLITKNIFLILV